MIKIHRGYVTDVDDKSIMTTDIEVDGEVRQVLSKVDREYGKFLSPERADYALSGLIAFAMRNKHDIVCEAPVTEELLFNVREMLIPSLVRNDAKNYHTKITADMAAPLDKLPFSKSGAGGVGTGISCGVDSFHVLAKHLNSEYASRNLTHLTIFNNGSINQCYAKAGLDKVKRAVFERAFKVAAELNIPIVQFESNFHKVFPQDHLRTHTFMDLFAFYSLQKLWKVYYYASASPFEEFKLAGNSGIANGFYDLLMLDIFSIDKLRLYLEGAEGDRNDKVRVIADFPTAKKYLHVCTRQATNCGLCDKCLRTQLALEAIDKLDEFSAVFNLDLYKSNAKKNYIYLCTKNAAKNPYYTRTYRQLYPKHKELFDEINAQLAKAKPKIKK